MPFIYRLSGRLSLIALVTLLAGKVDAVVYDVKWKDESEETYELISGWQEE